MISSRISSFLAPLFSPHRGCGDCSCGLPFKNHKPLPEGAVAYPGAYSPLEEAEGFAVMGNIEIPRSVMLLLKTVGPSAVVRAVALVVVNALYLKSLSVRPFHVSHEVKRVLPSLADSNPSGSVSGVLLGIGVVASGHHPAPDSEEGFSPSSMGSYGFSLDTPARNHLPGDKAVKANSLCFRAAIALAKSVVAVCSEYLVGRDDDKFAKSIPRVSVFDVPLNHVVCHNQSPLFGGVGLPYTIN